MDKLSPRVIVRYVKSYMVGCGANSRIMVPHLRIPSLVLCLGKITFHKEQQQQRRGTLLQELVRELSPGWMGPLRASITAVLNSFFIRAEPVADGAPPVTWSQSWRIGFLQEWEICNQGNHLSFILPRSSVPFSYRTGSLSWAILIPSSQNSLIQGVFHNFQAVAGSWNYVQLV